MNITLNTEQARAGSGGSSRIDGKGKYKGVIKHAKYFTIPTGSKWVEFSFTSDSGQEARVSFCIESKEGKETYGMKKLQAVMACCSLRSLTVIQSVIKEYDYDTRAMVDVTRDIFTELTGVKVGLALFREDQTSKTGNDFFSMELSAPFNYQTEQTAQEVLDQAPAQSLERIVQSLKDKDSRPQAQQGNYQQQGYQPNQASQQGQPQGQAFDNSFDDDIPF